MREHDTAHQQVEDAQIDQQNVGGRVRPLSGVDGQHDGPDGEDVPEQADHAEDDRDDAVQCGGELIEGVTTLVVEFDTGELTPVHWEYWTYQGVGVSCCREVC